MIGSLVRTVTPEGLMTMSRCPTGIYVSSFTLCTSSNEIKAGFLKKVFQRVLLGFELCWRLNPVLLERLDLADFGVL